MADPRSPDSTDAFSDEQLSAYVDGEGSAAERAAIARWLTSEPEAAARVQAWEADREALRAAWAPLDAEPVPSQLAARVWRRGPPAWWPRSWAWPEQAGRALQAAAWLLVFGLGAVTGAAGLWMGVKQQQAAELQAATHPATAQPATGALAASQQPAVAAAGQDGWVQRAAFAHSVYVPEPRHAVEVKAQEEHLARWLTRRIQADVKLFDLRAQGFELVGGRLLPDGPGKSAQLMYQDAQGLRVTVYLRKPEPGTMAAFRYERHGDLGMFYWVEEDCGYAIVGPLPKAQLLALAEAVFQQDNAHTATAPAKN